MTQSGQAQIGTQSGAVFHSLTGLRYVLACWIAYFHIGLMFDASGFGALPLLELGMTRVDVFFVLSGFVLAHVYWAREGRAFRFGDFFVARVARLYPLFLLSLAMIGAYVAAGAAIGQAPEPGRYGVRDLLASLFMLQSFGLTSSGDWNFPAWAVSAEFAGYLAFPIFLVVANALRALPLAFLGLAMGLLVAVELGHQALTGRGLNTATMDWGALRGASAMLVGFAARAVFGVVRTGVRASALLAVGGAVLALAAALFGFGVPVVVLGAVGFIIGLSRIDALGARTPLSGAIMRRLGEYSYAVFILHVPVFMILAKGLDVMGIGFVPNAWSGLALIALMTLIAAPVHHLIEEPARRAIRAAWKRRARPAEGAAPVAVG